MDIVCINIYASLGSRPRASQSEIAQQINLGVSHGKPVIFTEFNHWWGPVHWVGAEAVRDMGQFALEQGMTGTTLYKSCDVPDRHPGLIADPEFQGNVNKPMAEALAEFHADLHLSLLAGSQGLEVLIRNKRPFTIEKPLLHLLDPSTGQVLCSTAQLPDIPPFGRQTASFELVPAHLLGILARGGPLKAEYQSHAGLRTSRQVTAFVEELE